MDFCWDEKGMNTDKSGGKFFNGNRGGEDQDTVPKVGGEDQDTGS
jgi:hypothetical protein